MPSGQKIQRSTAQINAINETATVVKQTLADAIAACLAGDVAVGNSVEWREREFESGLGGGLSRLMDAGNSEARPIRDDGSVIYVGDDGLYLQKVSKSAQVKTSEFGGGESGLLAAISYIHTKTAGGRVIVDDVLPVVLSSVIDVSAWSKDIEITGLGKENTEIKIGIDDTSIFAGTTSAEISFVMRDLTLRGRWADAPKQSNNECWLINIFGLKFFYITRCRYTSSQKGLVKARASVKAECTFCDFSESARGAINLTGSTKMLVSFNNFEHHGDDAVSLHTHGNTGFPFASQHICDGNTMLDTQGIASMGARLTKIVNNSGKLIKGRFVACGFAESFNEGKVSSTGVVICNNVCEDLINAGLSYGDGRDVAHYYSIRPVAPSAGSLSAAPGYSDGTAIVPVYGNMDTLPSDPSGAYAGSYGFVFSGNTIARTIASGVNYSSYGYGPLLSFDGYIDPVVEESHLQAIGLHLFTGLRSFLISNNVISTGFRSIYFNFNSDAKGFTDGIVANNSFFDFAADDAIGSNASPSLPGQLDVTFENNRFNGDPYFRSSLRTTPYDGTWTNITSVRAFQIASTVGAVIGKNSYRNISKIANDGNAIYSMSGEQLLYCEPVSVSNNADNKGIRDIFYPNEFFKHAVEVSDPTNSMYGSLIRPHRPYSGGKPNSGFYLSGEVVSVRQKTVDANGMIFNGWLRITTGSDHVLGTDWKEIYSSVNSPAV